MRYILLVLVALTLTTGCKEKDKASAPTADTSRPRIALAFAPADEVSSLTRGVIPKESRQSRAVAHSVYQLGNIDTTTTFLFMLRNTGSLPIANIALATSNPDVVISPNSIGILSPDGSGDMSPIIQVTVKHGSGVGHYGFAPLLTPGVLEFDISASAVNGTDSILADATLSGTIRVADLSVSRTPLGGVPTPISLHGIHTDNALYADGTHAASWDNDYYYTSDVSAGELRTLVNTGNCPLVVEVHDVIYETVDVPRHAVLRETVTLAPNESYQWRNHLFVTFDGGANFTSNLRIWSQGVVFNTDTIDNTQQDLLFFSTIEAAYLNGNG